ncbi:caspase family protein [Fortiea contorta]|uniref:caspase family protein n=1 Tax=Fortiea contorta TaxID=1892405 RepID=UPI0003472A9A|nr:caspase family protein [Fortiea contorta]
MCPLGINSSNSNNILTTKEGKLWILLVGVNEYQDGSLPNLRYPAVDCQALGAALAKATQGFPHKEVIIHHDLASQTPTLTTVRRSLQRIVSQTQPTDSILLYFSGHGILETQTQQVVLCLADTENDNLLNTGFSLQEILQILGTSRTNQQLICLDTCHSGDMNLLGINRGKARDGSMAETLLNPTTQMTNILRKRAAQSKGFCALLSCDQGQQSWEFPELGHGVFTYYLTRGILGEAADAHGVIEADGLYKYVYRQTVQYIDKLNHKLRLINQQKLERGDNKLHPEYPLQTPKRIVEGVGELIVGFKNETSAFSHQRRALIIDALSQNKTTRDLNRLFAGAGNFQVDLFPQPNQSWLNIKVKIQEFLHSEHESISQYSSNLKGVKPTPTSLLYLRGHIEEIADGEAWLILKNGVRLSRSWLRQELRRAAKTQQIIILDCPEATSLESWIEDLQCSTGKGQCIIGCASPAKAPELFSQVLLETLVSANPQTGLSVSKWIEELQKRLVNKNVKLPVWVSETEVIVDILPGNISKVFHNLQQSSLQEISETAQFDDTQFTSLPSRSGVKHFVISAEQHTELEQLLKQYIGLITPAIFKKNLPVNNSKELVEKLASYLSPEEQDRFRQQALIILEKQTIVSVRNLPISQIIDADFINKCEQELVDLIGPIARFILQGILQSYPQISSRELVNKLIAQIPCPQQAREFQHRMIGK